MTLPLFLFCFYFYCITDFSCGLDEEEDQKLGMVLGPERAIVERSENRAPSSHSLPEIFLQLGALEKVIHSYLHFVILKVSGLKIFGKSSISKFINLLIKVYPHPFIPSPLISLHITRQSQSVLLPSLLGTWFHCGEFHKLSCANERETVNHKRGGNRQSFNLFHKKSDA